MGKRLLMRTTSNLGGGDGSVLAEVFFRDLHGIKAFACGSDQLVGGDLHSGVAQDGHGLENFFVRHAPHAHAYGIGQGDLEAVLACGGHGEDQVEGECIDRKAEGHDPPEPFHAGEVDDDKEDGGCED